MVEKWCDSQWQSGLQPECRQTCGINVAQMKVTMAEVQTMGKTKITAVVVTMDETVGVDTIALAWH